MNYSIILDIAIVVIFLLYIIVDSIRGFFKSITSLVVVLVALVVSVNFCAPVGDWINEKYVNSIVSTKINEVVTNAFDKLESQEQSDDTAQTDEKSDEQAEEKDVLPILKNAGDELEKLFESLGTSSSQILASIGNKAKGTVKDVSKAIGDNLSSSVSRIIAAIVLYLATAVVVWLIMKLLDHLFSGKCLKGLNGFFGGVVGGIKGAVVVFVICYAICRLMPIISGLEGVIPADLIEKTYLVRYIGLYR